jgi:protein-S-isoprenylcysteine O-methyltransferase Ste14
MIAAVMFSALCVFFGLWLSTGWDVGSAYRSILSRASSAPVLAPARSSAKKVRDTARSWAITLGHFLFGYRDYLFPLAFVLLTLTTKPAFPLGSEQLDWWMDVLGLVVALMGQGCRVLAVGCVQNIRRGGHHKQITAATLIRTGFFASSRNPLYLGNVLIFCGLVLIANSYWWYVLALPGFVSVYWVIVLAEEDFLAKQFGQEYADYCRTVNRFIPTLTGLRHLLTSCSLDWKRVVGKEFRIFCSWISLAIGVLIWERWEQFGYAARHAEITRLLLLLLSVAIAYGVVRWLKKYRKLRL